MKKILLLFIVFIGIVCSNKLMAQLKLTGELRPRTEYRNGYGKPLTSGQDAGIFTSQRTRLNFDYTDAKFKVGLSLQDVRVWGDVKQLNTEDKNKQMLHEAWGELLFNKNLSLKLGRQELVYDDSRILGNVGWAQQARSHDLALLKVKTDDRGQLHVGLAYNNDKEALIDQLYSTSYKSMQFAWYHRNYDNFKFSLLFLNNGLQVQKEDENETELKTYYSQTFGTHVNYKKNKLGLAASAYYQTGKDATKRDLDAYLVSFDANYALSSNFKGNVGLEILSGTEAGDVDNKSFNPLYGTNHKFNGHMDYFYVGNHLNSLGLLDAYAGGAYSKDKISFGATVHYFAAQADSMSETGELLDTYLGTELDLYFGYKYSKSVAFKAGYSQMFSSDSMEVLKGTQNAKGTANWAWMMLVFTPNFIN